LRRENHPVPERMASLMTVIESFLDKHSFLNKNELLEIFKIKDKLDANEDISDYSLSDEKDDLDEEKTPEHREDVQKKEDEYESDSDEGIFDD
jgi:hypothetical protein